MVSSSLQTSRSRRLSQNAVDAGGLLTWRGVRVMGEPISYQNAEACLSCGDAVPSMMFSNLVCSSLVLSFSLPSPVLISPVSPLENKCPIMTGERVEEFTPGGPTVL